MKFTPRALIGGALAILGIAIFLEWIWLNDDPLTTLPSPETSGFFEDQGKVDESGAAPKPGQIAARRRTEQRLTKEELINRFAQCFRISTPDEHRWEFLNLLREMGAAEVPAVIDLLIHESKQGVVPDADWHALWRRWGALDGPAALDYHLKLPDSSWNGLDIWRTMLGWSQSNPSATAAWLQSHPEARHFDNAFLGYVEGFASADLTAATEMTLRSISSGDPLMWRATEQLAEQALRQGKLAGLEAWFDQLPADPKQGSAKHAAEDHVWWRLQSANFDTGVAWVRKHANGPWRSDHIIGEVADRLSSKDPSAALEWLENVNASPKDGSYPGLDKVVRKWAQKDVATLENWLIESAGGALQQQALAHYANRLAETNPEAAKGWLQRAQSAASAR